MCSTLPGDADEAVCARYCRPSSAHRHCAHCLCAGCDFCSDGGTANRIPPLPTRVHHAASRATVDRLRSRFWSSSGVIMRVWECSLAGCAARQEHLQFEASSGVPPSAEGQRGRPAGVCHSGSQATLCRCGARCSVAWSVHACSGSATAIRHALPPTLSIYGAQLLQHSGGRGFIYTPGA